MPLADELFSKYQFVTEDYKPDERAKIVLEAEKLFIEKEKIAHSRWWQEDALVNNRLTWLLQSQVILFAAYGFLARSSSPSCEVPAELKALIAALPWLGFAVCLVIALGVRAAWNAQRVLKNLYAPMGITVGVHDSTTSGGRIPGYLMPLIFVSGWGWLFNGYCGFMLFFVLAVAVLFGIERWLTWRSSRPASATLLRSA